MPTPRDISSASKLAFGALALVAATATAYAPALGGFFVKDDLAILTSAQIEVREVLARSWLGFYRPASELLLGLEHRLFGLETMPYHVVSLLAHLTAVALTWRIWDRLTDRTTAALTAALFALHPINTEAVSWISGQMSLMASLCALIAVAATLENQIRPSPALASVAVAGCAAGLVFYESTVTAPVLCTLIALFTARQTRRPVRWALFISLLAILVAYLVVRFVVLDLGSGYIRTAIGPIAPVLNLSYYIYIFLGGNATGARILFYAPEQAASVSGLLQIVPPFLLWNVVILPGAWLFWRWRRSIGTKTENISPSWYRVWLPLLWTIIALGSVLFLPDRMRRVAYLASPAAAALLATLAMAATRPFRPLTRQLVLGTGLALVALDLYGRNGDWYKAGALEQQVPSVVTGADPGNRCRSVAFDVPNLYGDALFFLSASTREWIRINTQRDVRVLEPHELESLRGALPECCFRLDADGWRWLDPSMCGELPTYTQGHNWLY